MMHAFIIKSLQRQHALGILCMMVAIMILFIYSFIIFHLLFMASCSGSMREASCGSMILPIIYYFFILFYYYFVFAAAACVKHPAGFANIISLFLFHLLFSKCMQQQHASGILRMLAAIMVLFVYSLFII
jgi:hypothetical protein